MKRKLPFRTIGSSHLVILLVWQFIIDRSLGLSVYKLQYHRTHLETKQFVAANPVSPWLANWSEIIMVVISFPLAGLLGEVVVGRYRLISHSLKALWLLPIAGSVLSIAECYLPRAGNTIYNIHFFLVVLPQVVLKGAFVANAIPLGLDQITDGSNIATCAFILWVKWTIHCGFGIAIN